MRRLRIPPLLLQTIVSPDGMIAHLFGPMEGSRHDSGMLRESQLLAYFETQMPLTATGGEYCIYGDPAYPLRPQLIVPFQGGVLTADQKAWNKKMSACRVSAEWGYAKVIQLFPFVDFKKNVKNESTKQNTSTFCCKASIVDTSHYCTF